MTRATILVVDDKRTNLVALDAVLSGVHELIFANSGPEAIAIVESGTELDLILMDVQMPDMDGFETAERIKRLPEGKEIPIAFITAVFSDDPYVRRGYKVGGIDYFTKPFDPELLKLKVEVYTAFRRRRRDSLALRHERAMLSAALENLPVQVLVLDARGAITGAAGWDGEARVPAALSERVDRVLRGGADEARVRFVERTGDGSERRLLGSVHKLNGAGAVVLVHDLTGTTRIEAQLDNRLSHLG